MKNPTTHTYGLLPEACTAHSSPRAFGSSASLRPVAWTWGRGPGTGPTSPRSSTPERTPRKTPRRPTALDLKSDRVSEHFRHLAHGQTKPFPKHRQRQRIPSPHTPLALITIKQFIHYFTIRQFINTLLNAYQGQGTAHGAEYLERNPDRSSGGDGLSKEGKEKRKKEGGKKKKKILGPPQHGGQKGRL